MARGASSAAAAAPARAAPRLPLLLVAVAAAAAAPRVGAVSLSPSPTAHSASASPTRASTSRSATPSPSANGGLLHVPIQLVGRYVRVGLTPWGTLGSGNRSLPGLQFDASGTGRGFLDQNDWLAPGDPFEGWALRYTQTDEWGDLTSSDGANNNADPAGVYGAFFGLSFRTWSGAAYRGEVWDQRAVWSGVRPGLYTLTHDVHFNASDTVMYVTTTVTADPGLPSPLTDVYFGRFIDPDCFAAPGDSHNTTNSRGYPPYIPEDNIVFAEAWASRYALALMTGMGTADLQAAGGNGSSSGVPVPVPEPSPPMSMPGVSTSPSRTGSPSASPDIPSTSPAGGGGGGASVLPASDVTFSSGVSSAWASDPRAYYEGIDNGNGDYAIGLGFRVASLPPGSSVAFQYAYVLAVNKLAAGIAAVATGAGGGVPGRTPGCVDVGGNCTLPSGSPTASVTAGASASRTATGSGSNSGTPSRSPTGSWTAPPTGTPSRTGTPSGTPSGTPPPTPSKTSGLSPDPTPSGTGSASGTPSLTGSASGSPSATASPSGTPSVSASGSPPLDTLALALWPQAGHSGGHTGASPYSGPEAPPGTAWAYAAAAAGGAAAAAVAGAGSAGIRSAPVVDYRRRVVFPVGNATVAAVNGTTGRLLWMAPPGVGGGAVAVGRFATVVLAGGSADDGGAARVTVSALDAGTGAPLWVWTDALPGVAAGDAASAVGTPVVAPDGAVHVGLGGPSPAVVTLDGRSGALRWRAPLLAGSSSGGAVPLPGAPLVAVGRDGIVVASACVAAAGGAGSGTSSAAGSVLAVLGPAAGSRLPGQGPVAAAAAALGECVTGVVVAEGGAAPGGGSSGTGRTLYLTTTSAVAAVRAADGALLWTYAFTGSSSGSNSAAGGVSVAVDARGTGTVYAVRGVALVAIDTRGRVAWAAAANGSATAPPALLGAPTLDAGGRVYAVGVVAAASSGSAASTTTSLRCWNAATGALLFVHALPATAAGATATASPDGASTTSSGGLAPPLPPLGPIVAPDLTLVVAGGGSLLVALRASTAVGAAPPAPDGGSGATIGGVPLLYVIVAAAGGGGLLVLVAVLAAAAAAVRRRRRRHAVLAGGDAAGATALTTTSPLKAAAAAGGGVVVLVDKAEAAGAAVAPACDSSGAASSREAGDPSAPPLRVALEAAPDAVVRISIPPAAPDLGATGPPSPTDTEWTVSLARIGPKAAATAAAAGGSSSGGGRRVRPASLELSAQPPLVAPGSSTAAAVATRGASREEGAFRGSNPMQSRRSTVSDGRRPAGVGIGTSSGGGVSGAQALTRFSSQPTVASGSADASSVSSGGSGSRVSSLAGYRPQQQQQQQQPPHHHPHRHHERRH